MKTGTAVRLTNQKIYEICHKAERGMESTIIFLDEALMNKLKNLESNNNDATRVFKCVEQLMKEIIEKLNAELLDPGDAEK